MDFSDTILKPDEPVLVTGASGFIGERLVESLVAHGFRKVRCLARPSANVSRLQATITRWRDQARIEVIHGNLLSRDQCMVVAREAVVIYHLAAGTGIDSFPDAFMNSVVTTRNLLDAALRHKCLRRFVSVSSFSVYTNQNNPGGKLLDEASPIEEQAHLRGDAYCFAKVKQDELVKEYGEKFGIPYVIVRPGVVYGPGKRQLVGRVGMGTFGIFLHLGGCNRVPLTYVDNCADAIALAGAKQGVDREVFNVVDDDLPSSRTVLRMYKERVRRFRSIYVPRGISYLLYYAWEKYCEFSNGQLPPVYNRRAWRAYWKGSRYSNEKLKRLLGWTPRISTAEGLNRYLEACRVEAQHA